MPARITQLLKTWMYLRVLVRPAIGIPDTWAGTFRESAPQPSAEEIRRIPLIPVCITQLLKTWMYLGVLVRPAIGIPGAWARMFRHRGFAAISGRNSKDSTNAHGQARLKME